MALPAPTSSYKVQTAVFEGPLDLLLQLIEHAELDITVVALASVTDQYLEFIHNMDVPADEISAFLVMAAKLLQIKSEALLPRPPAHDDGEENLGEELARQLRIYKRYKEMGAWLEDRDHRHLHTYLRLAPLPTTEKRLDPSGISLSALLSAAEAVFAYKQEKAALGTVIALPKITIREKILLIASRLKDGHNISFNSILGEHPSRLEVVVTFLALLELVKRYQVTALQDGLFQEIKIDQLEALGTGEELDLEFE